MKPLHRALVLAIALVIGSAWGCDSITSQTKEPVTTKNATYFPPRRGVRGSRRGFIDLLKELATEYTTDPSGVVQRSQELATRVVQELNRDRRGKLPPMQPLMSGVFSQLGRGFDSAYSGWGSRNKFPMPARL